MSQAVVSVIGSEEDLAIILKTAGLALPYRILTEEERRGYRRIAHFGDELWKTTIPEANRIIGRLNLAGFVTSLTEHGSGDYVGIRGSSQTDDSHDLGYVLTWQRNGFFCEPVSANFDFSRNGYANRVLELIRFLESEKIQYGISGLAGEVEVRKKAIREIERVQRVLKSLRSR